MAFGDDFGSAAGGGSSGFGFKLSNSTFSDAGGAAADLFAGFGDEYKAKGAEIEAGQYRAAAGFADQNVGYTTAATAVKEMQQQREATLSIGRTTNAVAGAGFAQSGSSLDLLRDSASQAALGKQVLGFQGLVTEAGYKQQEQALNAQADAADVAAQAAKEAESGSFFSSAIKGAAAIATLL